MLYPASNASNSRHKYTVFPGMQDHTLIAQLQYSWSGWATGQARVGIVAHRRKATNKIRLLLSEVLRGYYSVTTRGPSHCHLVTYAHI